MANDVLINGSFFKVFEGVTVYGGFVGADACRTFENNIPKRRKANRIGLPNTNRKILSYE